jgi:methionyl aminopeptidase
MRQSVDAIGRFAKKNRYTLIQQPGQPRCRPVLHDEPEEIATWPDKREKRIMKEGQVFTVEPFLSFGATFADDGDNEDDTGRSFPSSALTVQFEHTVVVTRNGPVVLTCRIDQQLAECITASANPNQALTITKYERNR